MKHRIIMTLAALVCFAVGYAGNIYVEDFTLKRGDIGTLKISLTSGASGSVGVQFDVALPDGFSLAEVDNKVYSFSANQPDDLTCSVSDIGSEVNRFVLYSNSLKSLQQFELMTINIQAGSTIALQNYDISIGNVAFSDINGNVTKENGTVATVKLTDFFTLLYKVDNIDYKSYEIEYGATIIPEPEPTKDNYTFSGWSEIPTTMPAHDVTITGTFSTDIVEIDGVSYILNPDEKTARVTKCLSGEYAGSVVIPSIVTYMLEEYNVTSIGEKAFYNCTGLTSVEIPNSVLTIGQYAFYGCSGLTIVSINSNSLMSQTYWMGDIFGKQVKKYIIGNDVTTIGKEAFASCSNIYSVSIPSSVTKIGESAFYNCTGLTAVSIPGNLERIGDNVFSGCTNLTSVNLAEGLQTISSGMFRGCSNLTSIVIPNSVTEIGSEAFSGCSSLISVTIPNEVSSIGMKGFRGCSGLTSITFGNSVEYIGENAFEGCSGLTSITLPNSLRNIGTLAFYKCTGLTSVEIPSNVTSMGDISVVSVFSMCDNLVTVTINSNDILENIGNSSRNMRHVFGDQVKTYIIGDGVTCIGSGAFSGCTNLTTVAISNSVTTISGAAFSGCIGLTTLTIPNSVTTIGSGAFYNCIGLTAIEIPNSVISIGEEAFQNCSSLTAIEIPNSVTSLGDRAFEGCSSLESISINSNSILSKAYTAKYNLSHAFGKQVKTCVIGNNVTSIGDNAFRDCTGLTEIKIPNSVITIGSHAFYCCSGLTKVIIPNSVTSIENGAFGYCTGLTEVTIPNSVTSIKDCLFENCSSLISITLGDNVTSLGQWAFAYCSGLTSIEIPNTITSIDEYAFSGCSSLTSATIPDGVTIVSKYIFNGCSSLTSVTIPNCVTNISEGAFSGCTGLSSVLIPKGIINIGRMAFSDCSGLASIEIPQSVKFIGIGAFYNCSGLTSVTVINPTPVNITQDAFTNRTNATLYVPKGSVEAYQAADYWKEFKEIKEISLPTYKLIYMVDGEEYKSYDIYGGESITPESAPTKEGYTFSGWSEIPATMPAHDVTVTGTFSINSYKLTYMIDNEVYKNVTYEYGATITPEPTPEGNYATFEWTDLPQTMPAHDVVVHATYTTGITDILKGNQQDVKVYSPNGKMLTKPEKGINIIRMKDGTTRKIVVK